MIKGKENLWHLWYCSNFGGNWREGGGPQGWDVFYKRTSTGNELLYSWPGQVSLQVDMRSSKASLLKLLVSSKHSRSWDNKLNNMSLMSVELSLVFACTTYVVVTHAHWYPRFLYSLKLIFDPNTYASHFERIKLLSSLPGDHAQRRSGVEIVVKLCLVWAWLPRLQSLAIAYCEEREMGRREKAKLLLERWQESITFPKLIVTYFRRPLDF